MKRVGIDGQVFAMQPLGGISRYFGSLLGMASRHGDHSACNGEGVDIFPYFSRHRNIYLEAAKIGLYCPQSTPDDLLLREGDLLADGSLAVYPQPDVIHSTYYAGLPFNTDPSIGVKLVSSLYDMIPECFPGFFPYGNPHQQKMEWLEASDRIVSISEASSAELLDHRPHLADRLQTIHLASALPELDGAALLNNPVGAPYFLYVGSRSEYKNATVLLKALRRCQGAIPEYGLVFAGGPPPSQAEQMLIEELGLTNKILFVTPNDQLLANLYASAAAVLVSSLAEGFSLPLVEGLAFDTPVLCSDITVHREVGTRFCTFVSPVKTQDWADAMAEVTSLPSPSARLGEGYAGLKSYYSFPRVYEEHIALYQSL